VGAARQGLWGAVLQHDCDDRSPNGDSGAAAAPVVHPAGRDADVEGERGLRDIGAEQKGRECDAGVGARVAVIEQNSIWKPARGVRAAGTFGLSITDLPAGSEKRAFRRFLAVSAAAGRSRGTVTFRAQPCEPAHLL